MRYRGVPFDVAMRSRALDRVADAVPARPEPPRLGRGARRRFSLDPSGQGLVEFAISFPIVMLMILFGVDFGRVFLGWVTLTNAVREAANFAAINPNAWSGGGSIAAQAEYERLINAESDAINCTLPATLPDPSFPNGTGIGSPAIVAITCEFSLITPIIGNLVGNPLDVSASASFPIRSGAINGTPVGGTLPTASLGAPTASPGATAPPAGTAPPGPTATPIPTPSPIVTPVPTCTVPDLISGAGVRTNQATKAWTDNGFAANNLAFNPLVPPHYRIRTQSLTPGASVACTSSMTVTP